MLKSEQSLDEMISVEKSFDCIISEIRVLDLTAHVILTKIKKSKLSTIPFIIFTSDHYPEHLKACAELGADLVLNKPLDYFKYLEKAKSIMERITEDKSTYIYRNENPCV